MPCRLSAWHFYFSEIFLNLYYQSLITMSARSFWTILLKVLGIYVIIQGLLMIPSSITLFEVVRAWSSPNMAGADLLTYVFLALYNIILVCVFWFLIKACLINPEWTIDKLKLDQGIIEEQLNISMHRSDILTIVIMVIGGITLVDSLPLLCQHIFTSFQQTNEYGGFKKNPATGYLIISFVRTVFGIFMLTSSRLIVNFIEKKRRAPGKATTIE